MRFRTSLIVVLSTGLAALAIALPRQDEAATATFEPGKQHRWLGMYVGDWNATTRRTMGEATTPEEGKHTARVDSLLDGRFVRLTETFDMMGQPAQAEKTFGFNVEANRFEGTWMYSGTTAIMGMHGAIDADTHTIVMDAAYASTGSDAKFTVKLASLGRDKFVVTLISTATSEMPAATFETTYERAAK